MGHAARCIPIINALIRYNFDPIIASDGGALELLKKEFPQLPAVTLPSYNISYPKNAKAFRLKLVKDAPHLLKTIQREKKVINSLIKTEHISGLISDNRFGVRHTEIPSVFITHQLRVLSGSTTWVSTKLHQTIISKFDQCWVPDHIGSKNLSGVLGHAKGIDTTTKYLGPLSRFTKLILPFKQKLLVLLSGPEPQRALLAEQLLTELKTYSENVLFIKGKIEAQQTIEHINNITIYNFMTSTELEKAINESEIILSRSGYTTIMDLAMLEKKAFFIPTPGQFEQEYLAEKLKKEQIAPYCKQDDFKSEMLLDIAAYKGFNSLGSQLNYTELFSLF
ncbi:glycosyltransferase [Winogradskyella sp.]|uniref:glycosyltransferase n=1 Tax=Winogradskyella sp. TaxID=1883156 RepID=UPI003703A0FC